jgi:hypothetical protein
MKPVSFKKESSSPLLFITKGVLCLTGMILLNLTEESIAAHVVTLKEKSKNLWVGRSNGKEIGGNCAGNKSTLKDVSFNFVFSPTL